jgi:anti-sigma regulatory factor (Ser/Thr protein kinase)
MRASDPLPLTFRIPSREAEILGAADRVLAALGKAGLVGPRGAPRLKLALIELITNAVEHGNRFDPQKAVTVTATASKDGRRGRVTIADEGAGLDARLLERDLDDIDLSAKRGRGLSLVKRILGAPPALNEARNAVTIEVEQGRFA